MRLYRVAVLLAALGLVAQAADARVPRSEEHTSELQSQSNLVCRLLLEKKNTRTRTPVPLRLIPPHYLVLLEANPKRANTLRRPPDFAFASSQTTQSVLTTHTVKTDVR